MNCEHQKPIFGCIGCIAKRGPIYEPKLGYKNKLMTDFKIICDKFEKSGLNDEIITNIYTLFDDIENFIGRL